MKKTFNKKEIIEKITPLIENTAIRYNLIPLEISLEKENKNWFLRIYIYCVEHPIGHLDCENLSRGLDDILDEIIPFKYYLEVSSPGLEKRLKSPREFQIFKGHKVTVKLKNPVDETKTLKGIISNYSDYSGLTIIAEEKSYEIEPDNIFSVKLNDIEQGENKI